MTAIPSGGTMTVGAAAALLVNTALTRIGTAPLDLDSLGALAVVLTYVGHAFVLLRKPENFDMNTAELVAAVRAKVANLDAQIAALNTQLADLSGLRLKYADSADKLDGLDDATKSVVDEVSSVKPTDAVPAPVADQSAADVQVPG